MRRRSGIRGSEFSSQFSFYLILNSHLDPRLPPNSDPILKARKIADIQRTKKAHKNTATFGLECEVSSGIPLFELGMGSDADDLQYPPSPSSFPALLVARTSPTRPSHSHIHGPPVPFFDFTISVCTTYNANKLLFQYQYSN